MGRTFLDIDMARAADLLGMERRQAEAFRDLERGHFIALGPALSRRPLSLRIAATETEARSQSPRLMPMPSAGLDDARTVILAAPPPEAARTPRRAPAPAPPDLLSQLIAYSPAAVARAAETAETPTPEALADRRARLDAILAAILADPEAGFRAIGVLYQDFLVRCRIEGLRATPPDLPTFRRMLTHARAGIGAAGMAEDATWQDVSVARRGAARGYAGHLHDDRPRGAGGCALSWRRNRDRPRLWHPVVGPRSAGADLHGGAGADRLPARRRRPADRDAGGTCLGHGARRSQCRGSAGG